MTDDKKITDLSTIRAAKREAEIQLIQVTHQVSTPSCKHSSIRIDAQKAEVECEACGEKLNPVWLLTRMCNEETRYEREWKKYLAILREYKKKSRCKCEHCGKFTNIKIKKPTQW